MSRSTLSWLALAFAGSMAFQAYSADNARRTLSGWGEVIDPDGDCRIALEGDNLTISIPPARHDLSVEVGDVNAPRILRPIEGDFIAQVKVAGNVRHAGKTTSDHYLAYHDGIGESAFAKSLDESLQEYLSRMGVEWDRLPDRERVRAGNW